jgi:hypothetical protein
MFFFSSLEKDHSTSWSRWFHHLEWICYVEDARPFVWMALVHLITPPPPTAASTASTASTAATEPAEHESHGVRGQHQLFG